MLCVRSILFSLLLLVFSYSTNGGQYYNSGDRLPPGHIISPAVAERLSGQLPATPTMSERLATSSHSPYLNQSVLRKPVSFSYAVFVLASLAPGAKYLLAPPCIPKIFT